MFIGTAMAIDCPDGHHECTWMVDGEEIVKCCRDGASTGLRGELDVDSLLAKRDEIQYYGYGLSDAEQKLRRCESNCSDGRYACSDYCYSTHEESDEVNRCRAACRARESACKNNCL